MTRKWVTRKVEGTDCLVTSLEWVEPEDKPRKPSINPKIRPGATIGYKGGINIPQPIIRIAGNISDGVSFPLFNAIKRLIANQWDAIAPAYRSQVLAFSIDETDDETESIALDELIAIDRTEKPKRDDKAKNDDKPKNDRRELPEPRNGTAYR